MSGVLNAVFRGSKPEKREKAGAFNVTTAVNVVRRTGKSGAAQPSPCASLSRPEWMDVHPARPVLSLSFARLSHHTQVYLLTSVPHVRLLLIFHPRAAVPTDLPLPFILCPICSDQLVTNVAGRGEKNGHRFY